MAAYVQNMGAQGASASPRHANKSAPAGTLTTGQIMPSVSSAPSISSASVPLSLLSLLSLLQLLSPLSSLCECFPAARSRPSAVTGDILTNVRSKGSGLITTTGSRPSTSIGPMMVPASGFSVTPCTRTVEPTLIHLSPWLAALSWLVGASSRIAMALFAARSCIFAPMYPFDV